MGAAAYNRGNQVLARDATERASSVVTRMRIDRQAHADATERLRARVADLERDLARARRCLAAERIGRERLRCALLEEQASFEAFRTCVAGVLRRAAVAAGWEGWQ